jgi:hypothetical protein
MLLENDTVSIADFEGRTGWVIKPEGACKGDICVPLPAEARNGDTLDVRIVAERIGMPLVRDDAAGLSALGPEAGGRALTTAEAPELALPDWRGEKFRLSTLRGQKVLLVAWASW